MQEHSSALVLGLGRSGAAAARLLMSEGTSVTVIDSGNTDQHRADAGELEGEGATVLLGREELPDEDFPLCVVSPGIAVDAPWPVEMERRGAEVLAELELAWRRLGTRTLAVTGSNGKSTLARLCHDALSVAGYRTELAGNCGVPASVVALRGPDLDWVVMEVSSFQLERVVDFRPDVGVLLNLAPNHLDRHGDMATYGRVKGRLFARMTPDDVGIVPAEPNEHLPARAKSRNQWLTFGLSGDADYEYRGGEVYWHNGDAGKSASGHHSVSVAGTIFANDVMGHTASAAVAAIHACGAPEKHVAAAARGFEPLPHRMTTVAEINGIRFVDDSEATNVAAMTAALEVCDRPVRLIAGGILKEHDVSSAKEVLASRARAVYVIGEAASALASAWGDAVPCRSCGDLEGAFEAAYADARKGETVLLSPACSSFDQFVNCEVRGDRFAELVHSIDNQEEN